MLITFNCQNSIYGSTYIYFFVFYLIIASSVVVPLSLTLGSKSYVVIRITTRGYNDADF